MQTAFDSAALGRQYVRQLPLNVTGRSVLEVTREHGIEARRVVKLDTNENPLGMSPRAKAALTAALKDLHATYPDSDGNRLREELHRRFGLPVDWITLGNGSSEILQMATQAFAGTDCSVLLSQYSFLNYRISIGSVGATAITVPANDFGHDLNAMLAACRADTTLIFVSNPNNPTGTLLPARRVEQFLDRVPEHIVVLLDEAYVEYLPEEQQTSVALWVRRYPNLILARTFSKAHGLASLRMGYCFAQPPLTDLLNRVRLAYNTNSLAQTAAVAALEDDSFLQQTRQCNDAGREQLYLGMDALGIRYVPTATNFIMTHFGNAALAARNLLRKGIVVRPLDAYQLPEWMRITIGTAEQNRRLLEALHGCSK